MNWTFLNGLLALAVTMIVLSTVVAAIVEFLHSVRSKRQRYMRGYLLNFFDTQLVPMFQNQLVQLASDRFSENSSQPYTETEQPEKKGKWKKAVGAAVLGLVAHPVETIPKIVLTAVFVVILAWISAAMGSLLVAAVVIIGAWYWWDRMRQDEELARDINQRYLEPLKNVDPEKLAALNRLRQKFANDIAKIGKDPAQGTDYVTRMTPTEFAAALGRSEVAGLVIGAGRDKLDTLITDLLRRFDDTGTVSRAEFQRRSARLSVYAAFLTAFFLNINAITLLEAFFSDDELSARVVGLYTDEQLEGMAGALDEVNAAAYVAILARSAELKTAEEKLADAQTALDGVKKSETTSEDARAEAQDTVDELRAEVAALRVEIATTVGSLTDVGVPVGWRYFPFCLPDRNGLNPGTPPGCTGLKAYAEYLEDGRVTGEADETGWLVRPFETTRHHVLAVWYWLGERMSGLGSWLVGILLAGVLIGLGGPFWFDFYKRLSMVTQIARGMGLGGPRQALDADKDENRDTKTDPQTEHAPKKAVDAFRDAVDAQSLVSGSPPRRLLNNDGT